MTPEAFAQERQNRWNELDELVARITQRGPRRLPSTEIEKLLDLYLSATADLARLRALGADTRAVQRLNRLIARAHAQVYRAPRRRVHVLEFFHTTFPCVFRSTWRYSAASFFIMVAFGLIAYVSVQDHPNLVADILGGGEWEFQGNHVPGDFIGRFVKTPAPILSSFVTTNNIKVALTAFAFGITFGIGTVYMLIVNGTMVGGFAGAYAKSGLAHEFWVTILPHGALEMSAIVVAGGSGLLIGYSLWCPGNRTRMRALQEEALRAVQLVVGLVPAFIVAGLFEGFVTPHSQSASWLKASAGAALAVGFWTYLLTSGRAVPSGRRANSDRTP